MHNRRGETLIDLLITLSGVVGSAVIPIVLLRTTPLPKWVCFIVGIPVGAVVGWLTVAALLFTVWLVLLFPLETFRKWRQSLPK